jgi:hypothetical protein
MSDRAYWLKEQRAGYGFVTRVPVVVLRRGEQRATVLVPVRPEMQAGMGETVVRHVGTANLIAREEDDAIDSLAALWREDHPDKYDEPEDRWRFAPFLVMVPRHTPQEPA